MRSALDRLYLWAGCLAGFFLILIFALMMMLAVGRQFGLNVPSGDDFASWAMAAMSFLGLAHTFKRGEMIRVGLLLERLDGRMKHAFQIWALVVSAGFIGYFAWYAGGMTYDSWRFNDISTGVVPVPLWFPQLGMSIGIVVLLIAILDELVHVLRGNAPTFEKPPPKSCWNASLKAGESDRCLLKSDWSIFR
jgi:TRAP-type C4-dicarboxylate transport system permease small subunit